MRGFSQTTAVKSSSSTFLGQHVRTLNLSDRLRNRDLQLNVQAYKKKGKRMFRQGANGMFARNMPTAQKKPPELPVDPENEEFIMFVRSKMVPRWIPYTVMKGGWSANALAKAQGTKWGRNLYGETLIKNIGQAFYQEVNKVETSIRQNIPALKNASEFEYGFKIRDKENPNDWYKTEDIQLLPPKAEVESGGIIDNVKDLFTGKKKLF